MPATSAALQSAPAVAVRAVRSDAGGDGAPRGSDTQFPDVLGDLNKTPAAPPSGEVPPHQQALLPRLPAGNALAKYPDGFPLADHMGESVSSAAIIAETGAEAPTVPDVDPARFLLQTVEVMGSAEDLLPEASDLIDSLRVDAGTADSGSSALAALVALGGPVAPPQSSAAPLPLVPQVGSDAKAILGVAGMPGRPLESPGAEQVVDKIDWTVVKRETHFAPLPAETIPAVSEGGSVAGADELAQMVSRTSGEAAVQAATPLAPRRETSVAVNVPAARERFAAASALPIADAGSALRPAPLQLTEQMADMKPVAEGAAVLAAAGRAADVDVASDPSAGPSPVHQVFHRVLSELQGASSGSSTTASTAPAAGPNVVLQPAAGQPLRSIEIALEPEHLGKVTIKLSVRDDVIRLQLDVAERPTMGVIEQDKDVLATLMKSAGYQVDSLAVRHVDADRSASFLPQLNDPAAGPRDGGQSALAADAGSAGARSGQGQRSFDQQPGSQQGQAGRSFERNTMTDTSSRSSASGVYI